MLRTIGQHRILTVFGCSALMRDEGRASGPNNEQYPPQKQRAITLWDEPGSMIFDGACGGHYVTAMLYLVRV